MAKRIIENGKYNLITCSECGCKFAFDKVDVKTDGIISFVSSPPIVAVTAIASATVSPKYVARYRSITISA